MQQAKVVVESNRRASSGLSFLYSGEVNSAVLQEPFSDLFRKQSIWDNRGRYVPPNLDSLEKYRQNLEENLQLMKDVNPRYARTVGRYSLPDDLAAMVATLQFHLPMMFICYDPEMKTLGRPLLQTNQDGEQALMEAARLVVDQEINAASSREVAFANFCSRMTNEVVASPMIDHQMLRYLNKLGPYCLLCHPLSRCNEQGERLIGLLTRLQMFRSLCHLCEQFPSAPKNFATFMHATYQEQGYFSLNHLLETYSSQNNVLQYHPDYHLVCYRYTKQYSSNHSFNPDEDFYQLSAETLVELALIAENPLMLRYCLEDLECHKNQGVIDTSLREKLARVVEHYLACRESNLFWENDVRLPNVTYNDGTPVVNNLSAWCMALLITHLKLYQ